MSGSNRIPVSESSWCRILPLGADRVAIFASNHLEICRVASAKHNGQDGCARAFFSERHLVDLAPARDDPSRLSVFHIFSAASATTTSSNGNARVEVVLVTAREDARPVISLLVFDIATGAFMRKHWLRFAQGPTWGASADRAVHLTALPPSPVSGAHHFPRILLTTTQANCAVMPAAAACGATAIVISDSDRQQMHAVDIDIGSNSGGITDTVEVAAFQQSRSGSVGFFDYVPICKAVNSVSGTHRSPRVSANGRLLAVHWHWRLPDRIVIFSLPSSQAASSPDSISCISAERESLVEIGGRQVVQRMDMSPCGTYVIFTLDNGFLYVLIVPIGRMIEYTFRARWHKQQVRCDAREMCVSWSGEHGGTAASTTIVTVAVDRIIPRSRGEDDVVPSHIEAITLDELIQNGRVVML